MRQFAGSLDIEGLDLASSCEFEPKRRCDLDPESLTLRVWIASVDSDCFREAQAIS
jgi:hypothetical protein